MPSHATIVRGRQRDWAHRRDLSIDTAGYTESLDENLFVPLSPESRAEFAEGGGNELGESGERGKMQALHSSSALACNVFEYWRGRDSCALANALGVDEGIVSISFERKFPTGLRGNPPNLDVVLVAPSGLVTAIECKFLEPYGPHGPPFKDKYFETEPGLWEAAGFPRCQALAERLYSDELNYYWLYAEQLLKHVLGLDRLQEQWALVYLWYEVQGATSDEHAAEAEAFASIAVSDGIDFRALSYQSLFRALKASGSDTEGAYLTYLGERYFEVSD